MLGFLQRLFSRGSKAAAPAPSTSPVSVAWDEQGIHLSFMGQAPRSLAWGSIELVAIRIEDDFLPFPYWYVGNEGTLLRIPNDAVGSKELFFDGFGQHLAGYKSDATFRTIIEASGPSKARSSCGAPPVHHDAAHRHQHRHLPALRRRHIALQPAADLHRTAAAHAAAGPRRHARRAGVRAARCGR